MLNIATELTSQFSRFATLNAHQLAGQAANLEFWADEVGHCLAVIDQYNVRFNRMSAAQQSHAAARGTLEFWLDDPCCTQRPARRPRRVPDSQRSAARRDLCDAFYRFLIRCHRSALIDEPTLTAHCRRFDISVDPQDLPRRGR
jgi:hypothetical protein